MTNITPVDLTDGQLLSQVQQLVKSERKLSIEILYHLLEVEKRRLYAQLGFDSLFAYAVRELGYSEAAASRRINSMRMLRVIPDAVVAIEKGTLNLSTVSSVQVFVQREKKERGKVYSSAEQRDLLQSMESKSKRECEKILAELSPASVIPQERQRVITSTLSEVRVVLNEDTLLKIEKIKGLLAHQNPDGSLSGLIDKMADLVLDRIDPAKKEGRILRRKEARSRVAVASPVQVAGAEGGTVVVVTPPAESGEVEAMKTAELGESANAVAAVSIGPVKERGRWIPAGIRRQVWLRDGGQCTFVGGGRRCGSRYGLQIDHVKPFALGGSGEVGNLRLLCSQHNRWEAIQQMGSEVMAPYLMKRR